MAHGWKAGRGGSRSCRSRTPRSAVPPSGAPPSTPPGAARGCGGAAGQLQPRRPPPGPPQQTAAARRASSRCRRRRLLERPCQSASKLSRVTSALLRFRGGAFLVAVDATPVHGLQRSRATEQAGARLASCCVRAYQAGNGSHPGRHSRRPCCGQTVVQRRHCLADQRPTPPWAGNSDPDAAPPGDI